MNVIKDEFLASMKSSGAIFAPANDERAIITASNSLQAMRAAILPLFMIELYKTAGGIMLGDAYVFGPKEINVAQKFPVPSIVRINHEISAISQMRGKTVFGRNDLFWFAFDAFGTCFMLDNLTLNSMRRYDDPWKALTDCLIIGKM
ncbi:MAG: hypothetical protein LBD50_00245 [Rickettsiales bacterium]|jgi:hypothetical protein|nr:hypothetical protein [Rickettsiales bacterium]